MDQLGTNVSTEHANVASDDRIKVQQVSADVELPIDTSMYVEPKEESKDDVQHPTGSTIITIDESGIIRNMESGIKNLAIIDNFDSSNNLGSKIPSSIASINSRTDSTNNNLDTFNTTEANRDIKEMAIGLQNRVEQEIKDIFNITKIKNTQKIEDTKSDKERKFSFESYYSLSDDEEWSDLSHNDSSASTIKTSHHITPYNRF